MSSTIPRLVVFFVALTGSARWAQGIQCGQDGVGGEISQPGESDVLTFELTDPGWIDVAIGLASWVDPGFHPCVNVYSPGGAYLGGTAYDRVDVLCPTAGTYTLVVFDLYGTSRGAYDLSLQGLTSALSCGPPIACGEDAVTGGLDFAGDTDTLVFDAPVAGWIDVAIGLVSRVDAGFHPCVSVYGPDGAYVGGTAYDRVDVLCPAPGRYTILVFDLYGASRGTYELSLQGLASTLSCGSPIACGEDGVTGDLELAGDTDTLVFDALAPGWIAVAIGTAAWVDPGFHPCLAVYDPDGNLIGSTAYDSVDVHCPTPGRYTILVFDLYAVARGTYTLSLQGLSSSSTCGRHLRCEHTASGSLDASADTEAFEFTLADPDTVLLEVGILTAVDPGFAPSAAVYGPDGTLIAAGILASSTLVCRERGIYTVLVSDDTYRERGSFTVRLDQCWNHVRRK